MNLPANAALLVIDFQQAIDDAKWREHGGRNNPQAEANVSKLLGAWRAQSRPVFHIRHDSTFAGSPYRPGQPAHAFKQEAQPLPAETVIAKRTNSAFIGTNLEQVLRDARIDTVVIAGVITNNSVEATVRMAGNLGFETILAEDATFTFALRDCHGRVWSAEDVHALSLANLNGEYCTVLTTNEILALATRA
jgi:nicotinamidase-related amidase